MKPRVALIVRSTFDSVQGGDTRQVLCTARELRKLEIDADILKASDPIDYHRYDLLHLFNLIRPADHLRHVEQSRIPYVVSTIYLDYSQFDRLGRGFIKGAVFRLAGRHGAEYLKNIYRMARRQDRLVSASYLLGHRRAVRKILSGAKMLLPNSASEYSRLQGAFGMDRPFRIIPNGIDTEVFGRLPDVTRNEKQVICVGQVYGLKNQHRLIEATRRLGAGLLIIGKPPPNHRAYYDHCRKIAHPGVRFLDFLPQQELAALYAGSKVHALPSWFETTGLASLEAGAMGCNLVVGVGGDTADYFTGRASFCDARDTDGLTAALQTELSRPTSLVFRDHILSHFTWEHAARTTRAAYFEVLGNG